MSSIGHRCELKRGKKVCELLEAMDSIAGDCIIGPLSQAHIREGLADLCKR